LDLPKEELKNGPVMNRSCTDFICCLLFLAFLCGMGGTGAYGYLNGDPMLLLTTWDFDGINT
jgi:choline transporter-like protein 2/4/5